MGAACITLPSVAVAISISSCVRITINKPARRCTCKVAYRSCECILFSLRCDPIAATAACKCTRLKKYFWHFCYLLIGVHNTALLLIETFTTLCDACVQTLIVQYAREQNTTHTLIARFFTSFIFYSMNARI